MLLAISAAALALEPRLEEVERGVVIGVEDGMHVIGSPDDAEHGDRLVRRDDQLDAGACGARQSTAEDQIDRAAIAVGRLVRGVVEGAVQAEAVRDLAAPNERRLAARAVYASAEPAWSSSRPTTMRR